MAITLVLSLLLWTICLPSTAEPMHMRSRNKEIASTSDPLPVGAQAGTSATIGPAQISSVAILGTHYWILPKGEDRSCYKATFTLVGMTTKPILCTHENFWLTNQQDHKCAEKCGEEKAAYETRLLKKIKNDSLMREASCLQSYPEVKSLFGFEFLPLNSQRQIHHCSVICQCQIVITWKKIRMPSLKHFDQIYEFSPKTTKSFWTDQKIPLSSQRPKSCYPTEIIARVLSTKQLPDMEVEQWAIRPPVVVEERTRCDCLIWSMKCTCNPYGGTQREHRYVPDHCILGFQTPRTAATSISQDLQAPAGAIVANTQTCPTQPLIAGQVDTSTTQASGSGGHSHDQSQLTDRTPAVNEPQGPTTSAEVNQFLQNTQFGFNCRTDILPDENGLPQWSTSLYAMECFLMSDGATPGPLRENCQCPWPLADPLECELLQQSQNNTCTNLDAQSRSQEGQSKRQNTRGMNYGEQGGRFGNLPNFI